jgi:hypothetical protein
LVDDDFEIIAVEVKGSNSKNTWEMVGIYRTPYEDVRVIEMLADRTGFLTNSIKQSIIGGDLNLPQVDWKGVAEGNSVTQAFINYFCNIFHPAVNVIYILVTIKQPITAD